MSTSIWVIPQWELIARMIAAVLLGGAIGIEREWSNHAAGFRTHILVCIGSATIMLLSIYGFSQFVTEANVRIDPSRLAAQVVSGIGFLGAGAILRNGKLITGLTTAASIWVVAAIGLCVGAGFITGAVTCTILVLISLVVLNKWEKYAVRKRPYYEIEIVTLDHVRVLGELVTKLSNKDIDITDFNMTPDIELPSNQQGQITRLCFTLKSKKEKEVTDTLMQIANMDIVISLKSEHRITRNVSQSAKSSISG